MNVQRRSADAQYCFPHKSLLQKRPRSKSKNEAKATAAIIQQTLAGFGAGVRISNICAGARFTRYEIVPEPGIRVNEIAQREPELRRATAASYLHIEKSIPGKSAMGIEIANREFSAVALREILESADFTGFPSDAACVIGENTAGEAVIADLSEMPHLFIAGAAGSGKTSFLSSFLTGILYRASPNAVKIILIDTKGTDLSIFNGIPHLLAPAISNPSKALNTLRWVLSETEDRYQRFVECGVRNLAGYNRSEKVPQKLPRIIIVLDDLSDFMPAYKGETERLLVRIAQTARAAGVHLIISTQNASEEVATEPIKANIPGRIAFRVSSAKDSRAILDEKGAEKLLGNGDMLFKARGLPGPVRVQGAYVSGEEIAKVAAFLKNNSDFKDKQKKILVNMGQFEHLLSREEAVLQDLQDCAKTFPLDYDSMDGWEFESFCADILRENGYEKVEVTKGSGDQGVDVFAERDGIKYAVQCKRYSHPVGNKAIQEIFAGKQFYHCHVGIVMTSNYFTKSAKELAKENGIILWDRDFLAKFARERSGYQPSPEDLSTRKYV